VINGEPTNQNENATIYISTPSSDMFEEYEGFLEEFSQTTHILTSQGGTATMHIEKADSFHVKDLNSEVETIYTPNWQDPFITKKITTSHGSHFTV
jgi:phage baseplate assembly protein gpV